MITQALTEKDISAIACKIRRIDTKSENVRFIRSMVNEMLKQEKVIALTDDEEDRRNAFRSIMNCQYEDLADRITAVSGAVNTLKALTEGRTETPFTPNREAVTIENYEEKLSELFDLIARYRPSQSETERLARKLRTKGAVQEASRFQQEHAEALVMKAAAIKALAEAGKLEAFDQNTTTQDVVNYVMACDGYDMLHAACKAANLGYQIGGIVSGILMICLLMGGLIGAVLGCAALMEVSPLLAFLGSSAVMLGVSLRPVHELFGTATDCVMEKAGEAVSHLAAKLAIMDHRKVQEPDPAEFAVC